jgi:hypothetical protein
MKTKINFTGMNKMLKLLVILIFLVSCEKIRAQTPSPAGGWTKPSNAYGIIENGHVTGIFEGIPTSDSVPTTIPKYDLGVAGVQYCTADSTLYIWHPTLHEWLPYHGGTGGGGSGSGVSLDEFTIGDGSTLVYTFSFADSSYIYNILPNLDSTHWEDGDISFYFAAAPFDGEPLRFKALSLLHPGGGGGGGGILSELDPLFNSKFGAKSTSDLSEGTHLYWTNARGDARYPQLTSSYSNPSWLNSLAWSKITSRPTSVSGYGILDAATLTGIQTLTNKTLPSPKLNTSSTAGYVWTATSTDGSGSWQASTGGGGSIDYSFHTITYSTTPTLDGSTGTNFQITLTGNATISFTGFTEGYWYYLDIIEDGTGGRQFTLPAASVGSPGTFVSGTILRTTTTGGATDVIAIRKKGSAYQIALNPDLQ